MLINFCTPHVSPLSHKHNEESGNQSFQLQSSNLYYYKQIHIFQYGLHISSINKLVYQLSYHRSIYRMASSSCNKSFCSNYMLLKPEECSVLDLARILFSSNKNMGQKEFVDCPNEEMTKEPLSRRWVIFISILVQKVLIATAKPLAGFGNAIEYWLNLQNVNGGFFRLVFNSLSGTYVTLFVFRSLN